MQLGFISKKGDNTTEIGWDPLLKGLYLTNRLGQFVPGLVSDKCLPDQKIPTETKNNLYTCAVGADYGQRDKKRPQTQFLKSWVQMEHICMAPALNTTKGAGKPPI